MRKHFHEHLNEQVSHFNSKYPFEIFLLNKKYLVLQYTLLHSGLRTSVQTNQFTECNLPMHILEGEKRTI